VNKSLNAYYLMLCQKFNAISLREQFMVLLFGVALIAFITYMLLIDPLMVSNARLDEDIKRNQQQLDTVMSQIDDLSAAIRRDPNQAVRQRIEEIRQQIDHTNDRLKNQTASLVPANKMPQMLENVLTRSKGLTVVSLQSIAPTPILLGDKNEEEQDTADLYRHGVSLVIEGSYFDIQAYLARLEALQWQFYWQKFDYTVTQYPVARVAVDIYTLSTNKAFRGV